MKPHFWNTVEDAFKCAEALEAAGETVYMAQATFKAPVDRTQENALFLRSFFMDIDCGDEKPYPSQAAGLESVKVFCAKTGLPYPAMVNSGNGLYAYWPTDTDMAPDQWKTLSLTLKKIAAAVGFIYDTTRTSDSASVLRPVGSYNKKSEKKLVHVINDCEIFPLEQIIDIIRRSAENLQIDVKKLKAPTKKGLNSEFLEGFSGPPADPELIADGCAQIRAMRDTRGQVTEPIWYAAIGVLRYAMEGHKIIHEWSEGHDNYSFEETESKIEQHKMPPTTCAYFGELNPSVCIGCRHNNKIKTPVSLGRISPRVELPEDRCSPPEGFEVTEDGVYYKADNIRVYGYDIYPSNISYDVMLGYEVITFRHKMPHVGWSEFTMRSALLHDPKTFFMCLHDNHVQVVGLQEKKFMGSYLEQYVNKLRAMKKVTTLYSQMGWHGREFVLGSELLKANEDSETIGLAAQVPHAVKGIKEAGDRDVWVEATKIFNKPDMEAHAFMFLAAAFGAPLMQFTGYSGALICGVGRSGAAKTLMSEWGASAWGDPKALTMYKEDTKNSIVGRLGAYGSLPLTIDEVSNLEALDISDLLYKVTQGRDKVRLNRSGMERSNPNQWRTIAVVSSNHSLGEKLATLKADASAELNRMLEFAVRKPAALTKTDNADPAGDIYRMIYKNYGSVGKVYAQYLVDNYDSLERGILAVMDVIFKAAEMRSEERFWCVLAATTLYGGVLAKKAGLIKFELGPVRQWIIETIMGQREAKKDNVDDSITVIGNFLDSIAPNTLVVSNSNGHMPTVLKVPNLAILARYEVDTRILYVNKDSLRAYLKKKSTGYNVLKQYLMSTSPRPVLLDQDKRKVLSSGLIESSGTLVRTWVLDMSHPALGNCVAELVKNVDSKEKVA